MTIGHQKQIQFLHNSIKKDKISQGYLFEGPLMVGKKKVAIDFLKTLFCEEGNGFGGCGECRNCLNTESRNNQNIIFIEIDGEIPVSTIRSLKNTLSLKSDSYKVVLIDNAHNLNQEASNAFLKMLEEPFGKTIFILITNKPNLILNTITSRLERLKFFPVQRQELESILDNSYKKLSGVSEKDKNDLLLFAKGRPGMLFKMIEDKKNLNNIKDVVSNFMKILNSDISSRFQIIESLDIDNLSSIFDAWFFAIHQLMLKKINGGQSDFSFFGESCKDLPKENLNAGAKFLLKLNSLQDTNINKKLALEAFACLV